MSWWELALPSAAGVLVVFTPGLFLALALGIRSVLALFLAPLMSFGSLGFCAVVLGLVGVRWSVWSFLALHMAICVIVLLLLRLFLRGRRPLELIAARLPRRTLVAAVIALPVAAVALIVQLLGIFGQPDAISQSYDNIFHLNAVRHIFDSGNASSLTLNGFATAVDGIAVYPAGWHGSVALVLSLFPASIPVALNAMTIAVVAFVWPASMAALAIVMRPKAPVFVASTVVISSALVAFPGLMLKWGILYPNLLGYALLPALLALVVVAVRAIAKNNWITLVPIGFALAIGVAAATIAHPNTLVSAAILALPLLALEVWRLRKGARSTRVARLVLTFLIVVALGICALVRPVAEAAVWPRKLPNGQAVGEYLTNSFNGNYIAIAITIFMAVGIWLCLRSVRLAWLPISWAIVGLLWVMVTAMDPGRIRWIFTGPWYSDSFRIGAISAIPVALLAGIGLAHLLSRARVWITSRVRRQSARRASGWVPIALVLVIGIALSYTQSQLGNNVGVAREFQETADSLLITTDEQAILDQVVDHVAEDELIAVNPWDGSAVVYALEGRKVTQFHTLGAVSVELSPIPNELRDWRTDPEVCQAVRDGNVRWYLALQDTLNIGGWADHQFEGYEGVTADTELMTPVVVKGDMGLYEISGCGPWT